MSLYELVFIARQEVSPVRAKELAKKVSDFITSKGGKIQKEEYWYTKYLPIAFFSASDQHRNVLNITHRVLQENTVFTQIVVPHG